MHLHLWGTENEQIEFANLLRELQANKRLKVTVWQQPIEAGHESGDRSVPLYRRRLSIELNR